MRRPRPSRWVARRHRAPTLVSLVEGAAVRIFASPTATLVGERYSVGPYAPAVASSFDEEWCVLDLKGAPVVLAHELFCALTWFARLRLGGAPPENPRVDMRDRDLMTVQDAGRWLEQQRSWVALEIDDARRVATMVAARAGAARGAP